MTRDAPADLDFRSLVERLPLVAYVCRGGPALQPVYVGPQVEQLLGYSPAEWLERGCELLAELLHPEDREPVLAERARTGAAGEPFVSEYRLVARDGRIVWVLDRSHPERDEQRRVTLVRGVMLDVTERRLAGDALRESERRYRSLMEEASDAILISLAGDRYVEVNSKACELLGYSREELLGLTAHDVVAPDDLERSPLAHEQIRPGETVRRERTLVRRDGSRVEVEAGVTRLHDGRIQAILRDVTERRRTEEALRESERRYRLLMEEASEAIVIAGPDRRCDEVNAKACELLGYSREELIGLRAADLLSPEERERRPPRLDQLTAGETVRGERALARKDGTIVHVESSARMLPDGRIEAILRDITERKRVEEALRASEARFRAVFEGAAIGIAVAGLDSRLIEANGAFADMLGYPLHELRGMRLTDFTYRDDAAEDTALFEKLRSGVRDYYEIEKRCVRKDGTVIWARKNASLVRGADDEPAFVIGMIEDVTERKHAEGALRESEQRFRAVFENALVAMTVTDDAGRIIEGNAAACALLGLPREEALGLRLADFTAPEAEDTVSDVRQILVESERPAGVWQLVRADGSRRDVEFSVTPGVLPARHLTVLLDQTDRRRLETELRQSQKMDAIGRLAGGIAHDFNNLLTAILGYSDFLLQNLDEGDPRRRDAEEIRRATESAASLTRQLLAYSRQQVLRPRVLDLNEVLARMEAMLRRLIGEDIELVTEPAADLAPVRADPGQLEQVIVNLAVNARDAMPRGGTLTIRTRNVELGPVSAAERSLEPGAYVAVSVTDTGFGMSKQKRAHIFEPFFTTKEQGKGTGLGLSTVYGIVGQSGGAIRVESEPGAGSTFWIYLQRAREPIEAVDPPAGPQAPSPTRTATVLLVEDEEVVREVVEEMLRGRGYEVISARRGSEALELAAQGTDAFDVLLTDIVMPEMGGPELAEALGHKRRGLKVVFMSGYSDDQGFDRGVPRSAEFVQKPFSADELEGALRRALDRT